MIIKGVILLVLVIGAFAFLGIKVAESIPQKELKLFFFGLYTITIFTVFNVFISIYFFYKLSDKRGPVGKKGLKGLPGETGEHGVCRDDNSCKYKTLELMLKNYVESGTYTVGGNTKQINSINQNEKKIICFLIKKLKEVPSNNDNFTLNYIKKIKSVLSENIYQRSDDNLGPSHSLVVKIENLFNSLYGNSDGTVSLPNSNYLQFKHDSGNNIDIDNNSSNINTLIGLFTATNLETCT